MPCCTRQGSSCGASASGDRPAAEKFLDEKVVLSSTALLLVFLVIVGSFSQQMLSCQTRRVFGQSLFARHVLLMLTFWFFLVFTDQQQDLGTATLMTLVIYSLFIVTARTDFAYTISFFVAAFMVYLFDLSKRKHKDRQSRDVYSILQVITLSTALITIFYGFFVYYKRQRAEHSRDWSWTTFVFGSDSCDTSRW